ncbi:MAG: hypothetical protein ABFC92_06780, partial [Rectinema sp.]
MPHHADSSVTGFGVFPALGKKGPFALSYLPRDGGGHTSANRLLHSYIYGVVLVIPGHLLDQNTTAHILEHNNVPDKVQKPLLLE